MSIAQSAAEQGRRRRACERGGASVSPLPGRTARDAELIRRVAGARDKSAYEELVRHYAPRLTGWLVLRGEAAATAEDIVQDVMITVWRKAAMYDSAKASFSAWLFRATRNRWIDYRRRQGALVPTEPDLMAALTDQPVESAEAPFLAGQAAAALRQAMALLPPEQKQMLYLAFFEGLTHAEIAARTGVPLGTVKSRIRAPLKSLRTALSAHEGVGQ
jgi:RNA polymerase sigma-70 factor (ECF subfamily)